VEDISSILVMRSEMTMAWRA